MKSTTSIASLNAGNNDFDDFLAAQSGQGVPEVEGANFVKLMQSNSPEVDQHPANKKRVNGIQIGDFLFRGASPEIVRGDEGFLFQPLMIQEAWAEWNADGVNVDRHPARPTEAIGDRMPNGNSIEFTKYIIGALDGDANNIWVIPLKSTGLSVFNREIARALRMEPDFVAKDGRKIRLPLYAHLFKVTSRPDGNAKGSWRAYHFDIVGRYPDGMTEEQIAAAHSALRAVPNLGPPDAAPEILPPKGPRPHLDGGVAKEMLRGKVEIASTGLPPANDDNAVEVGVGMRPFAPLDLEGDDDITF
jgi:hypothetical protein